MTIKPVMAIMVDSDIVVRHGKNMIASQAFNHKPPMVDSITVQNMAVVEKDHHPITRHKKGAQVEIPKMVVGNKREIIGTKPKIHVQRHSAVVI